MMIASLPSKMNTRAILTSVAVNKLVARSMGSKKPTNKNYMKSGDLRTTDGGILCDLSVGLRDPHFLDPCITQPKVIIIGAGVAGLAAAKRFLQCGMCNFRVLEANDRVGGRLSSGFFGGALVELGADKIEGGTIANPVYRTAAEADELFTPLIPFQESPPSVTFLTNDGGVIQDWGVEYKVWSLIEKSAESLMEIGKFVSGKQVEECDFEASKCASLAQYLTVKMQQELLSFPKERQLYAEMVFLNLFGILRNRWGRNLKTMCAAEYSRFEQMDGLTVQLESGMVGLLAPLIAAIPNENIIYQKTVHKVFWDSAYSPRAIVKCVDGEDFLVDYVISTIPIGSLQAYQNKIFRPNIPFKIKKAVNSIKVGHVCKAFFEYDKPWWNPSLDSQIRLARTPTEIKCADKNWTSKVYGIDVVPGSKSVVSVQVSGTEALMMESCSEEMIAVDFTKLLRKFTGDPTIPFPIKVLMSKWASNKLFKGALSSVPSKFCPNHRRLMATPFPGKVPIIFLSGEASMDTLYGTIQGAYMSGVRDADRIIQLTLELKGPPVPREIECDEML